MSKKGFSLVELLIVVAIIGILAALLVPNTINAIQKAKQKSSMKEVANISAWIAEYVMDNGVAPTQSGTYAAGDAFYLTLSPTYVKIVPVTDQWGNNYNVWCGSAATTYGITGPSADDFIVASLGRDGTGDGFSFNAASPDAGRYAATDFNYDLVMYNGQWIRAPRTAAAAGS